MGESADSGTAALEAELSRSLALRTRLQTALAASDQDRADLRRELRVLESRAARLHDELAEAHRRQAGLHDELDELYRRQLGNPVPERDAPTVEKPPAVAAEAEHSPTGGERA